MPRPDEPVVKSGATRAVPRVLLILAAVFLVARIVFAFIDKPSAGDNASAVATGGKKELVRWVSPDSVEERARSSEMPILYEFAAAWCGPCKIMKAELFSDETAAAFINGNFVPSRVIDRAVEDGRNTPLVDDLQKRYKVKAFPTIVVVVEGKDPVILEGYAGKEQTLAELKTAITR